MLGAQQAGYNDIGILTAPDGRSYAVAVMIKLTSVPLPVRMTLMNNVVRAVIAQHDMSCAARPPLQKRLIANASPAIDERRPAA